MSIRTAERRKTAELRSAIFCVAALLVTTAPAHAGGLYLSEIGTPSSLGTAAAGNVTNRMGADSSWTNPAGMTGLDESTIFAGLQIMIPNVEFESEIAEAGGNDGGNAGDVAGIPSFFYVKPLNEKWRFGFSLVALMGGAFDYGEDFVGRYTVQEVALQGVALSPSFGYQLNDTVSIGFGTSIVYTIMDMELAINQAAVGQPDGKVELNDADDIGFQPFVGMQWQYSNDGVFGVVYRAEMEVDLEGDLVIRDLFLPLQPQSTFNMAWDNAQSLEIGIRQQLSDQWTVVATANWEDWSVFKDNVLTINDAPTGPLVQTLERNWDDTYKIALGFIRRMDNDAKFAFGASYDSSAVDDQNRTVDLPIDEQIRLSFLYGRDKGDSGWALGATWLWLGNGKVDTTAQGVRYAGEFKNNSILFVGATYLRRFGR
jgi:long-chain fatty acid transport protein